MLDNIYEILLRSDINTIRQFCLTDSKTYKLCTTNHFWQEKIKYENLPQVIFDDMRNIERIAGSIEINLKNKLNLWVYLYTKMKESNDEVKGILLINKIDQGFDHAAKGGLDTGIRITFKNTYEMEEDGGIMAVKAIIPYIGDNYIPKFINITFENNYKFIYTGTDIYNNIINMTNMMDENEVIRILTLFIFDHHTVIGNFDITNLYGDSLMDCMRASDYHRGMWAMINYKKRLDK